MSKMSASSSKFIRKSLQNIRLFVPALKNLSEESGISAKKSQPFSFDIKQTQIFILHNIVIV